MDPKTWSGSLPNQWGTAPMVRVGRSRWFNLLWLVPLGLAFLVVGVAAAQALRELPSVQAFVEQYPGTIAAAQRPGRASRPGSAGSTSSTCS